MKKTNWVVLGLVGLTASLAQASQLPTGRVANITGGELDEQFHIQNPLTGTISVDPVHRQVTLYVQGGPMAVCMAIGCVPPISSLEVTLPMIRVTRDHCGVVTYVAKRDQRPADGSLQVLTINDYSQMTCRYMTRATTVITYETELSGFGALHQKTFSELYADQLVNPFVPRPLPFEIDAADEAGTIAE